MVDKHNRDLEIEKLKNENALLKELLSELPFSFTYVNKQHSKLVAKKVNSKQILIQKANTNSHTRDEFIISTTYDQFAETELFLSSIFDFVPHHIVFVDGDGLITLCNLQTAKDLGVDRDQIIGKHIRELLQLPDEQIELLETLRTGIEMKDKEVLDVNYGLINTRILWNTDGSIKRVLGTFYFLNVIKEAEKQALAGRIAAGIAHEIRNPLTTVRGYLQLLKDKTNTEVSQLFSDILIPEIDRANKIISDFLSIAKPSASSKQMINLHQFLKEYLGKFLESEALLYNTKLDYTLDSLTRKVMIKGDQEELLQVFMNLFINAIQARSDQPLIITIETIVVDHHIQILFRDNGKGISPSLLPHIFDPFFSTKDDGTGLGLSVSKKIIESHGGSMKVTSDETGSIFIISFPFSLAT
ncbi:two-component system sensor histidine kinase NtrB [Metabacillus endolithicus]|uniref:histidine kinase n=1 Tax=Metabacillus endolithicus TaxID=1535204 RepID=A0ABW5C4B2_9BACI|nr:ATP-binding protein [Metabacillus endolithicus]UPG62160.1 ATP-binding protein [Metabacillus endolithicus]